MRHNGGMADVSEIPRSVWSPDLADFGTRLWATRRRLRWNRKRLSIAVGIPAGTLGQWERGEKSPRNMPEVVQAISDATGVDRDWLMWGETSRDSGPDGDLRTGNR